MSTICYVISLVLSVFNMTITIIFLNRIHTAEQITFKFFGDTELFVCVAVSIILLLIGILSDKHE